MFFENIGITTITYLFCSKKGLFFRFWLEIPIFVFWKYWDHNHYLFIVFTERPFLLAFGWIPMYMYFETIWCRVGVIQNISMLRSKFAKQRSKEFEGAAANIQSSDLCQKVVLLFLRKRRFGFCWKVLPVFLCNRHFLTFLSVCSCQNVFLQTAFHIREAVKNVLADFFR